MSETKVHITAEQLPEVARGRRVELVRGEVVEMAAAGGRQARLVIRLGSWMDAFVVRRKLGVLGTEWGFVLFRNPDVVRAPDIAFVVARRLGPKGDEGFFEGAPDLAVEVVSPNDRISEVQQKIREYLAAGTRLVWVIDPQSETVTAYHPSGDAHLYSGHREVPGEDVLPGFSFRPDDLFRLE